MEDAPAWQSSQTLHALLRARLLYKRTDYLVRTEYVKKSWGESLHTEYVTQYSPLNCFSLFHWGKDHRQDRRLGIEVRVDRHSWAWQSWEPIIDKIHIVGAVFSGMYYLYYVPSTTSDMGCWRWCLVDLSLCPVPLGQAFESAQRWHKGGKAVFSLAWSVFYHNLPTILIGR